MPPSPLPPIIAVVGCDGSGKSTITEALQNWLAKARPTVVCHLGKQSGNIGRAIARLPFFGNRLEKSLHEKAQTAQSDQGPGLAATLGIYVFTIRRVRRFRRMMRLRQAGNTIIADRFPQLDLPGTMDGLGLSNARSTGLVGWFARRERHHFEAMVANRPDLVIRLNVSLDVAHARKPDHRRAALARKIEQLSHLTFEGAPIVEIDAEQPLATVKATAEAALAAFLETRQDGHIPKSQTTQ